LWARRLEGGLSSSFGSLLVAGMLRARGQEIPHKEKRQNGISCNDRREPRAQTTPRGDTRRPTSGSQSTSEGEDCDVSRGVFQGPGTSSFSLSRRHERERPTEGRKEEVVEGWYISFKSWFLTVSLQDLEGRDVPTGEARPSTNSPSAR